MVIGGFQKFSVIDYPNKIAAVVFTQGCNFRCSYCHNPELVMPETHKEPILEKDILGFLEKRKGMLEGVTITGGEPLLHKGLPIFIKAIKNLGYSVKLDTNGSFPERLKGIVDERLVDYIAMDIKAPLGKYNFVVRANVSTEDIRRSIEIIMFSGLDYQFRTTVGRSFLNVEDLKQMPELIRGACNYVLQKFRFDGKIMDEALLNNTEYSEEEMQKFQNMVNVLLGEKNKLTFYSDEDGGVNERIYSGLYR